MMQPKPATVLVVEDEAADRLLLQEMLSAEGLTLIMAEDAEAALAAVAEGLPDLAIVDILLPGGIDGFELTRRLKTDPRTRHIPVMIVTALQDRESRLQGLDVGAEEFICKPVDRAELIVRVRNLLKLKEYQNLLVNHNRLLEQQVSERTAALQESEGQFRGLVEQSIAGICIIQDGKFTYMNSRCAEILGQGSASEAIGTNPLAPLVKADSGKAAQAMRRLIDGEAERVAIDFGVLRRDGVTIHVGVHGARASFKGRPAIIGLLQDISEKKHAEDALRDSEEMFRSINAAAQDALIMIDNDGLIAYWNPAAERILGYRAGEAQGQEIHRLIAPARYVSAYEQGFAAFRASGAGPVLGKIIEIEAQCKDGREIPVELSISAMKLNGCWHAVGILRDISERKQAEQDLLLKAQLLDSTNDSIFAHDLDGNFVYMNEASWKSRGYTRDELTGMNLKVLDVPEYSKLIQTRMRKLLEKGYAVFDAAHRCKDGSAMPVEVSARIIETGGRKLVLAAVRDSSERKRAEKVLRASEERHRLLFESSRDALMSIAPPSWRFTSANQAALKLFGASSLVAFTALGPWDVSPPRQPDDRLSDEKEQEMIATAVREGSHSFEWEHQTLDGKPFAADVLLTRMQVGEEMFLQATVRDTTERKRTEQESIENADRLRTVLESVQAGIVILDPEVHRIVDVNPFAARMIGAPKENIVGAEWHKFICPAERNQCPVTGLHRTVDNSERVLLTATGERRDILKTVTTIKFGGRALLLESFVDVTERNSLQQQQLHDAERFKRSLIETIGAMAMTVEKRDPYTAGHQRRVAELCLAIGRELDLPEDRLEGLRLGATIHDIGKIYVPAEILNRPGKLAAPEFTIIKWHPQIGYDIIKDVQFPWPVADMILQHHERLDGSGYPQGLKAEQIILEARIIAVADVVEAISSHRPYRPGHGIDIALAEIERGHGTIYDPAVADACLRLFREKSYMLPASS